MLSRVADSLYWMSRYLERAEHTARLLDVHLNLVPDQAGATSSKRRSRVLAALFMPVPVDGIASDFDLMQEVAFNTGNANSLVACVAAARENCRQVREQVSTEMWQHLNELYLFVRNSDLDDIWNNQPSAFLHAIKQGSHLFQGLTDSTLSHGQGWHFIQVARHLERTIAVANLLDVEYAALTPDGDIASTDTYLNWLGLLKGCTAFEAYSKVYTAQIDPRKIVEFLLLNAEFPHSICFGVRGLQNGLDAIAALTDTQRNARVYRLAGRLRALLDYGQVDEIVGNDLGRYLQDIQSQCNQIHTALYQLYIAYPIEEKLAA
jgi:uncharacterized alpha-E superfamily protein